MGSDKLFQKTASFLKVAQAQFNLKNYDPSLTALAEAYSIIRKLMTDVHELSFKDRKARGQAGEDS